MTRPLTTVHPLTWRCGHPACDVTGILKGFGDALEDEQPAGAFGDRSSTMLQYRVKHIVALRSVILIIQLAGEHSVADIVIMKVSS